jgi:hypothetical protein
VEGAHDSGIVWSRLSAAGGALKGGTDLLFSGLLGLAVSTGHVARTVLSWWMVQVKVAACTAFIINGANRNSNKPFRFHATPQISKLLK